MELAEKYYPDDDHVFVFDNVKTHLKQPEGSLSALKMPKGPSANFGVEVNIFGDDGKPIYGPDGKILKKKFWWEMVTLKKRVSRKSKPFIGRQALIFPMQVNSREWRLFWKSVGLKKHQKWRPSVKRSFLIAHLVKHNAAVIACYLINWILWTLSPFLKWMHVKRDILSCSFQSSTVSSILLSSAGDTQNKITGCFPHHRTRMF